MFSKLHTHKSSLFRRPPYNQNKDSLQLLSTEQIFNCSKTIHVPQGGSVPQSQHLASAGGGCEFQGQGNRVKVCLKQQPPPIKYIDYGEFKISIYRFQVLRAHSPPGDNCTPFLGCQLLSFCFCVLRTFLSGHPANLSCL